MVADWHGSGRGRHSGGARTTTMFLPAALLHDDDAMACLHCRPAGDARTASRSFTISKFHLGRRETERAERSTTSHDQPSFWTGGAGPGCCRFRPRYFFFLGSMQPFASVAMLPHSILSLKRCLLLGLSTESLPSVASRESSCVVAAVESQFFYHWKIHLSDG